MLAKSSQLGIKYYICKSTIIQKNCANCLATYITAVHICQYITYRWWSDIESNVIPISARIFRNVECQCVRVVEGDTNTAGCEWCLKHVTDQFPQTLYYVLMC